MKISKWHKAVVGLFSLLLVFSSTPAQAAVPQAPSFAKATLKVIVDNDFAVYLGNETNATRLFYQNDYVWMTQISNATTLDIYPQSGETYLYIAAMGGGGSETIGGNLNGIDIVSISGAQVASGRSPLGTGVVSGIYVTLQSYVANYNANSDVVWGPQNVTLAQIQAALTGATWSSATGGNTTSGVCCGSDATSAGLSGKGWLFPDSTMVVFRYPVSALSLPVNAGSRQVTVDWDAPAAGDAPTSYILQYKKTADADSAYTTFSTPSAGTTIDTVTGLTNGISYSFRVAGVNASGTGTYSVVRDATPLGPPPAPTALIATPLSSSAQIAFTDPISNGGATITNYEYSTNNGSSWQALSPTDITSPITLPGLTNGTTYAIKIRAVNSYGSGTASESVSVLAGLLSQITNLVVSNTPTKRLVTSLTVSLNVAGKATFLANGKRITGCIKVSSSGVSPNIVAACRWKPSVMGSNVISVQYVPTDNSYANGTFQSSALLVVPRTTKR
ncbi:MAG: hypothetical protein F2853_02165 [Actinobacteria bacterium]|uniref:Unannotated protein n=1 Tax=freshwater metagenome TaxID=449393 RepID=A0A6J7K9V3_9ZZZZ|nr:hypothetical protein [Actinomycetota bacterium]MSZ02142.1 hypothetical protein [Actinomycetota bacterium]